jgi:hypothetical protein
MSDVKISALPASTTPLAGTETLPIVQSGTTKQVSVSNLTAGRALLASSLGTTGDITPSGYLRFNNYVSDTNDFSMYATASGGTTVASQTVISFRTANAEAGRIHASGGVSIGNTVDKGSASLNVSGLIFPQQATTAPAYVKGAIYFDTTLNKLRVGGATTWETITSA